jgi:hypothetical protein
LKSRIHSNIVQENPIVRIIALSLFAICAYVLLDRAQIQVKNVYRDNQHYERAYNAASSQSDIVTGYYIFHAITNGYEPGLFFVYYLSSQVLDYSSFTYLSNIIFLVVLVVFLTRMLGNWGIFYACIMCFTDFYILVTLSEIQRLKFAVLPVLLCFVVWRRKGLCYGLLLLAIAFHAQMLLIFSYKIVIDLYFEKSIDSRRKKLLHSFIAGCAVLSFIYVFRGPIITKLIYYSRFDNSGWQPLLLTALYGVLQTVLRESPHHIVRFCVFGTAVAIASVFLGEGRLLMLIYEWIIFMEIVRLKRRNVLAIGSLIVLIGYNCIRYYIYLDEATNIGREIKTDLLDYIR